MFEKQPTLRILARPGFHAANPYTKLIYDGVTAAGARVDDYALRRAAFGRYDIVHVHWPESTFNASLPEALATTRSLLLAIDALRARGTKLVWTAHNLRAHERRFPRAESAFWRAFSARVDGVIALSQRARAPLAQRFPALASKSCFVIPHPHYRGIYPDGVTRSQARAALGIAQDCKVLLFFGRILDYKNVPALIETVRRLRAREDGRKVVLLVAGKPHDAQLAERVRAARGNDERVVLTLRHISDAETQLFFRAADLVVLPYKDFFNSGAALLALSFDRPVLMPRREAALELAEQVGHDWVHVYDELEPHTLELALLHAARLPPVTNGRQLWLLDPNRIARDTLAAYRVLANRVPSAATDSHMAVLP
ncbi:MAG: glycosyltransferase [Myxococcota bacterium]